MADAVALKKAGPAIIRTIVWGFVVILLILLAAGAIKHFSSEGSEGDTGKYDTVTTIECTPNGALFDQNGGWCYSEELDPGTYRVKVESTSFRLAGWKDNKVVSYYTVPPRGISLASWNKPEFEEFKQEFTRDAPVPKLKRVGAPIARIDDGVPFDPVREKSFRLEKPGRIGISINQIPLRNYFSGNQGKLVMAVEGEAD